MITRAAAPSIAIARYLNATFRRAQACRILIESGTLRDDDGAVRELDALDAVDALGQLAARFAQSITPFWSASLERLGFVLAKRRRFDLLEALLPGKAEKANAVAGAAAGLWASPAVSEDVDDVRARFLDSATSDWRQSQVGQLLALLGDRETAGQIADSLCAGADAASYGDNGERLAEAAPIYAALGDGAMAAVLIARADERCSALFGEETGWAIPFIDRIRWAEARVAHIAVLANNPRLPFNPEHPVSVRFINDNSHHYGKQRAQHERWEQRAKYLCDSGDTDGVLSLLEEVGARDREYLGWALQTIGPRLAPSQLDAARADRVCALAAMLRPGDPPEEWGIAAAAVLLANAGRPNPALAQLLSSAQAKAQVLAACAAAIAAQDRSGARAMVEEASELIAAGRASYDDPRNRFVDFLHRDLAIANSP